MSARPPSARVMRLRAAAGKHCRADHIAVKAEVDNPSRARW
ncbi:hypothetical protein AB0B52_32810 [Streptomyces griseofuscus]